MPPPPGQLGWPPPVDRAALYALSLAYVGSHERSVRKPYSRCRGDPYRRASLERGDRVDGEPEPSRPLGPVEAARKERRVGRHVGRTQVLEEEFRRAEVAGGQQDHAL